MDEIRYAIDLTGETRKIASDKFETICEATNVYEIVPEDRPVKLFADIDIYEKSLDTEDVDALFEGMDQIIDIAVNQISILVKLNTGNKIDLDYIVCESNSRSYICHKSKKEKWKLSLHIIVQNVMATKSQQSIFFKMINKSLNSPENESNRDWRDYFPSNGQNFFDTSVYSVHKFRSVHASKPGENRPLRIKKGSFNESVISGFFKNAVFLQENEIFCKMEEIIYTPSTKSNSSIDIFLIENYIDNGLLTPYAREYGDWFKIVSTFISMFDEETAWQMVDKFSRLSDNYDESANLREFSKLVSRKKEGFGIQTVRPMAEKTNKKMYKQIEIEKKIYINKLKEEENQKKMKEIRDKLKSKEIVNEIIEPMEESIPNIQSEIDVILYTNVATDYDLGFAFFKMFEGKVLYSHEDNCWYIFDKRWISDKSGLVVHKRLSNDFFDFFENYTNVIISEMNNLSEKELEETDNKVKKLMKLMEKLKKSSDKKNVVLELKSIVLDEIFKTQLNKMPNFLPLIGNMFDMNTNETIPMSIDYKFDFEMPVKFVDKDQDVINQYLMDLFSNNYDTMKCFISIIKTIISGRKTRYIYFWTGSGRNGKSLLLKLLSVIFSKFVEVISKDVILMKKSNSALNTEFEKLDKYRFGYITEIDDTDVLNINNIKAISGGDAMDLRTICKTNTTIYPTINLNVITNELPSFKEQEAILDRIVIFPFNNKFENDPSFEEKMMTKLDSLFTYIMKNGEINNFSFTEEMLMAKKEYQEENSTNYLEDYIEDKCDKSDKVSTSDFYQCYQFWMKEMGYVEEKRTMVHFTKRMKKLGYECKPIHGKRWFSGISFKKDVPLK